MENKKPFEPNGNTSEEKDVPVENNNSCPAGEAQGAGRSPSLPKDPVTELNIDEEIKKLPEAEPKKKKFRLGKLFYNNRFLMAFSVFCAAVLWVIVSLTSYTEQTVVISNVPVAYKLPSTVEDEDNGLGLKIIEKGVSSVDVTISGNRYIVGQIKADDLVAIAQFTDITGPGTYLANISVTSANQSNFKIDNVSQISTTVRLDRLVSREFPIETETGDYTAAAGFLLKSPTVSDETVVVTGPETELNKINRVVASAKVDSVISNTTTYPAEILLYDENGNTIEYATEENPSSPLTLSVSNTEITIVALQLKSIPVTIGYLNRPATFSDSRISISPGFLSISGPSDVFQTFSELNVGTINFNEVDTSHTSFKFSVELPSGCSIADKDTTDEIEVELNLAGMRTKEFTITNFEVSDAPDNKNVSILTTSLKVRITGPAAQIETVDEDSIVATIDGKALSSLSGSHEVPISVSIDSSPGSWVYGTPTAVVTVSGK